MNKKNAQTAAQSVTNFAQPDDYAVDALIEEIAENK